MRALRLLLIAAASALALAVPADAAAPDFKVNDKAPVLFQADRAVYDTNGQTVTLTGNVEVYSDTRTLTADKVTYDRKSGIVTADGNVIVRQAKGETLTADHLQLTGDLREGVIQNIGFIFNEHTRLAATKGTRTAGNVNTLEGAIFSPCKVCKEDGQTEPLWQIKSVKVIWDQNEKTISYEDATFEFFGTPLITVPAFSHADFTVKNATGFLAPSAGSSSDLGYFVATPYHWVLDPSYDVTLTPLIATRVNPVIFGEFRQRNENGAYFISGSYTYDDAVDALGNQTGDNTSYSHVFGRGRFMINDTMGWGFDLERSSSDTYLKRYNISDADRLTSRAYWEWRSGRSYATVSAYLFQGLRATDDPGTTPLVLPEAIVHYVLDDTVFGGEVDIDGSVLALDRSRGLDTQRVSAGVSWNRPMIFDGGQSVNFFGTMRGDLYRLTDPDPVLNPGVKSGDVLGRVTGYAGVDIRWPFVRATDGGDTQIIEPIAQLVVAPYGDGPDGIPNEDSQSLEFDDTNLFSPDKFSGLDRVESGPRANLGVRFADYFPNGGSLEGVAGFEIRAAEDPAFLGSTGLGSTQSDIVSRVSYTPWPGLTVTNRLRLDKTDLSVRRNEVYIQGKGSFYEVDASYLKLESDPTLTGLGPREEVSLIARAYFSQYWSVIGGARRDLEDDQMIESRFAVAYEDECSFLELGFRRRYTTDRDASPTTTVLVSLRLKALGDDTGTVAPLYQRDPYNGTELRDVRDLNAF